ncbi:MAG: chlorite dismutase family protein [Thermodesulfobacteriota bacterium]
MKNGENTKVDIREKGRSKSGKAVYSDRRLFVQFLSFGGADAPAAGRALEKKGFEGAVYADLSDPFGIGTVFMSEDENFFTDDLRAVLSAAPFKSMKLKNEYSMFGRTYSLGYESNLEETLVEAPKRKILDPGWPWAVWYPLRRAKSFETLGEDRQRAILGEHGKLGFKYGEAGFAKDIRLACHGIDKNDNDFVIGLLGKNLHPLSSVVQAMRKTEQTSVYIEEMGPFFAGKAVWKSGV